MKSVSGTGKKNPPGSFWLTDAARWLRRNISDLFKPEEVEVTFKVEGDNVTYTYTKVNEKQVA